MDKLIADILDHPERVRKGDFVLNAHRQLFDDIDGGRFPGLYLVITGPPKSHCDVKSDNLSLSFPRATALDKVEELIRGIQADAVRPIPDADAMENLKFSECLSPSIAAEIFVSRFDDRVGVAHALAAPRRMVKHV